MPSPLNNRLHGTGHFLSSRFLLFDMFTLTHSSLRVLRNFILPYQVTVPSLRTFAMPFPMKSLLTAAELALLMTPWHSPCQFLQMTSYHRPLPLSTKPSSCSCTRQAVSSTPFSVKDRRALSETTLLVQFVFLVFFFFNLNFILSWSIVDLQCCISFTCTAKWFSYTVFIIHMLYTVFILLQILFSYRLSQSIEYSSLCCTVGPC